MEAAVETKKITKYETTGSLTTPVNDLGAAQRFLNVEGGMAQFIRFHHEDLSEIVADVQWSLMSESDWRVQVIATRPLNQDELKRLSDWISGQNSDGLGEGFEQQEFAEHWDTNEWGDMDEESYKMSSFDWDTNECKLYEI